jgi:hypothetical protein
MKGGVDNEAGNDNNVGDDFRFASCDGQPCRARYLADGTRPRESG